MKKQIALLAGLLAFASTALADDVTVLTNLSYKSGGGIGDYERERCQLDLYLPTNREFASLLWFHGGALTGGSKDGQKALARSLAQEGLAVAAANYRLSPKAAYPAYIEDAAAAFAWMRANVAAHGGDSNRVFIGGHSAGGYLAAIVGMDPKYLRKHGLELSAITGLLPVSGQMMTHFTVRAERGLATNSITADEAAPIFHTSPAVPPMLVIMGDHDWPARLEENQYFVAAQKQLAGNKRISLLVVPDRNHGSIASKIAQRADPAREAILNFMRTNGDGK